MRYDGVSFLAGGAVTCADLSHRARRFVDFVVLKEVGLSTPNSVSANDLSLQRNWPEP